MFATDYDELLEFLDETVLCDVSKYVPHAADIYVLFTCTHCNAKLVRASCNPCWTNYKKKLVPGSMLVCLECMKLSPNDTIANIGPVR